MPDPLTRRAFLGRLAAAGIGGAAVVEALAACGSPTPAGSSGSSSPAVRLASPDDPVTWPIRDANPPIKDGLTPERNATLRLYNYADYIDPAAIKSFEAKYAKYGVKVTVSTFNDGDEAITKIRSGKIPFDVTWPSYNDMSKLVISNLIQPLNHSYLSNISNVWPEFTNPWYDGKWRYTVPYTVYTTGIGWRTDKVDADVGGMTNPYDVFWDRSYAGRIAVLDDFRSATAFGLLHAGITDVNTGSAKDLQTLRTQMTSMQKATRPKATITQYTDLPAGQLSLSQMWSGDIVNAVSYLPKGVSPKVLRYWFPADGKGMVDNDMMAVLKSAQNPVLGHLWINHLLDAKVAKGTFGYTGYQPPQNTMQPDQVVADGFIPENVSSAVVKREYFQSGYRILELPPAVDAQYHSIWSQFKAGA